MIPVLVVPVLARPELLYRMLESVDYPVGRVLVIDNGGHCSRHILTDIVAKIGSRLSLLQMPSNLGVPTSWNLGIKATPFVPWWLVSNFDVVWPAGSLEAMANKADPAALVLSGGSPPWCAFAIGERVVRQVGLFDESFHPAYWEDVDYERRCNHYDVQVVNSGISVHHDNSSTIAAGYQDDINRTFHPNAAYNAAKKATGDVSEGRWSLDRRRALSWD